MQRCGACVLHDQAGFSDLGEFTFVRTASKGDRLLDDTIDLAVLFLEPAVGEHLRSAGGFEFAQVVPAEGEGPIQSSWHFIHGFPVGLTKPVSNQRVERVSLACFLPLADNSNGEWESDFPDTHLDLGYDPALAARIAGSNATLLLPSPEGFSGCGIWRVHASQDAVTDEAVAISLVGIVHRFNSGLGRLRATRLEVLLAMLFEASGY